MSDDPVPAAPAGSGHVLEEARPLSVSRLWALERKYYEAKGVRAWGGGELPSYITTNPFIARTYARIVAAFLRDAGASAERPAVVIEMGAGPGRFAFLFLQAMEREGRLPFTYVMTDANASLLGFWGEHAALRPFLESGRLDFALFDAEHPGDLHLVNAGKTLGRPPRPVVLLANYVLDSIPHDAFRFEDGRLHEVLVTLLLDEPPADPDDFGLLEKLRFSWGSRPASRDYYRDEVLDGVLGSYAGELDGATLTFPAQGLRCIERVRRFSDGRFLFLSSDKGYHRIEDVRRCSAPDFASHGCVSLGANYHAIARYFSRAGGTALLTAHRHAHIDVCAFLLGHPPGDYAEVRRAYRQNVEEGGPEDWFHLVHALEQGVELPVPSALSALRFSAFDPKVLRLAQTALEKSVGEASADARADLGAALRRVFAGYYHVGEAHDLAFDAAYLLFEAGDHAGALEFYTRSAALWGTKTETLYNMGLCHLRLGQTEAALSLFEQAVRRDPAYEPARKMIRRVRDAGGA